MHNTKKVPILQLNEYITCKLCMGYYIDATTISECLHTFCRTCIVQYLATTKYCPVCDCQVHKSKPLLYIHSDKTKQDIVYKLVPRLFQNEMCRRREFYSVHPDARPPDLEQCGEASCQYILSSDETICLKLNYFGSTDSPRYLKCPAGLSVTHLQKLLRFKYGLTEHYRVDIYYNQDCLSPHLTLMDIAYIYLWNMKEPMELTYRIYENSLACMKEGVMPTTDEQPCNIESETRTLTAPAQNKPDSDWKEVQLQISETGEMCFTNVDSIAVLNQEVTTSNNKDCDEQLPNSDQVENTNTTVESATNKSTDNTNLNKSNLQNETVTTETDYMVEPKKPSCVIGSSISTNINCDNKSNVIENCISTPLNTNTTTSDAISICTVRNTSVPCASVKPTIIIHNSELIFNGKHKTERNLEGEPAAKQAKQTILNHTLNLGFNHLSNNHPLKRNSQIQRSTENTSSSDICMDSLSVVGSICKMTTVNPINLVTPTYCSSMQPKPTIINHESISSVGSTSTPPHWSQNKMPTTKLPCYSPRVMPNPVISVPKVQTTSTILKSKVPITTILNHKVTPKNKPSNSIGYKTLREPPKTWNPQIPRSLLLKGSDQKDSDVTNTKPAKFFKMRNNMPRYLGNPASGVKPLYQVHSSPEKDKSGESKVIADKIDIKKHSIVRIDPKTLKPIPEKDSNSASLSSQSELKINTSSVPIFSPLKLQSSPKSDRRSPKSPQSPKTKTSPSSKRDKLNLNFIPPNPFIPNLASPTLSPNQFLYPPGFPTYDHRLVAAYHNLLFGQRLAFPGTHPLPNINFDLSQRKAFDIPICTSPTIRSPSPSQFNGKEKQVPRKVNVEVSSKPHATEGNMKNKIQDIHLVQYNNKMKKKQSKESPKNEKSLVSALEKLTQNRVTEMKKIEVCSDINGIVREPLGSESPISSKDEVGVESPISSKDEESNDNGAKTSQESNNLSISNCTNRENTEKCSESKSELETQINMQSMQNGDKTVSNNNNNNIETFSLENIQKV